MLKVVIDTNVLIAGLLKDSTCRKIISHIKNSEFQLIISPDIFDEIMGVMVRPKFRSVITKEIAQSLIEILKTQAFIVRPSRTLSVIKEDPDDNRFLEAAVESHSDCIVSGDSHILKLKGKFSVPIFTVDEFLKKLSEEN